MLATLFIFVITVFVIRKIYLGKQLKRDITNELESIKQQFQKTQNESQLAKSLSVLLRRTSISYYSGKPHGSENIAGLTGKNWLHWLDNTHQNKTGPSPSSGEKFNSEIGKVLLTAPYMPDNSKLDFNAQKLITLCESWLQLPHKKIARSLP